MQSQKNGGKIMDTTAVESAGQPGSFAAEQAAGEERRTFLMAALQHDAVDGAVTELLFEHVVQGLYDHAVVVDSLPPLLQEMVDVPREADWDAIAGYLVDPEAPIEDPRGEVRSEQGNVFTVALIRGFLRNVVDEPLVADRLRSIPELRRYSEDLGWRRATIKEEVADALRSGTDEDWNIIAGLLIAEAREVTGPAANGGTD
jgi:hypothetical protein